MTGETIADGGDDSWSSGSPPSESVVEEIAEMTEAPPRELPPLYDVIDPDALDRLFANRDGGTVTFRCCGYEVVVNENGEVTVSEN